jgi:outer membrane immunogenic protein
MLRRIILASAGATALTGAALAADLRAPPPVYLAPPPVFTWSGLYMGGQLGYKWGNDNGNLDDFDTAGAFFDSTPASSSPSGAIGGAHIGYNWQITQWVLGVEADVDATGFRGNGVLADSQFFDTASGLQGRVETSSTIEGSFRGRIGFAWDRWLIYGTGGVAFTDVMTNYFAFEEFDSRSKTRVGWTAGGGIEYAFTPNWLFGVEYRHSDFGSFTDTGLFGLNGGPTFETQVINASHHLTQNRVQARASYKFDMGGPGPVVAKY